MLVVNNQLSTISDSKEGIVPVTGQGPHARRYEIRIGGRLGETFRTAFPGLHAKAQGGDTVLSGLLADQSALYGVLAELENLGLELIELRRLPPD